MSFVPPTFGSLGKKVADLFKKKFEYANTVTIKHKTTAGLTLESTSSVGADDKDKTSFITSGTQKVSYKYDGGEAEGTLKTAGLAEGVLKFTKLYSGLTVTVKGGTDEKPFEKKNKGELYASAEAEYSQDFFAVSCLLKHSQSNTTGVTGTGVIGVDGLSVGAKLYAESKEAGKPWTVVSDVGIEYAKNEFIGSLTTEKNLDVIKFGLFAQPTKTYQVGAEFAFDASVATAVPTKTLTVGTEYNLDAATLVKAKYNTVGDIHTLIQHKLANPSLQIALCSNFQLDANNKAQALKAKDFGITLSLGDL